MFINYFIHEIEKIQSADLDIIRMNNYPGCSGLKSFLGYEISVLKLVKVQASREEFTQPRHIKNTVLMIDTNFMTITSTYLVIELSFVLMLVYKMLFYKYTLIVAAF